MNEDVFRFCDDIGPAQTVHIYNPALGLTHNLGGVPNRNVASVSIFGLNGG